MTPPTIDPQTPSTAGSALTDAEFTALKAKLING